MVSLLIRERRLVPAVPTYFTRFIGRAAELEELELLLESCLAPTGRQVPGGRLVTLVGTGGAGKTRLTVELTDRLLRRRGEPDGSLLPDQVVWTDLAQLTELAPLSDAEPLTQAGQLARVVAVAAGLPDSSDPAACVVQAWCDTPTLLVLDNCEHLTRPCQRLAGQLLDSCPQLVIVATSRTPLRLHGSHEYAVAALGREAPSDGSSVEGRSEAAELFYDRAGLVAPAYPRLADDDATVELLCHRLDGVPLAIELAAPWVRVLSARDLLARTDHSLQVLASTSPRQTGRHRSMRAVLDSSWYGLSDGEQLVMRGLGTFAGGFTLDAAEAVAGATLMDLATLAERSLINRLPQADGSTRYGMHEVVRQYAVERLIELAGAEQDRLHERHLDYFVRLAESAKAAWETDQENAWLARLRSEDANLMSALTWALDHLRSESALRLCSAWFRGWIHTGGPPGHVQDAVDRALAMAWDTSSTTAIGARARTLHAAGDDANALGDFHRGARYFKEAVFLSSRIGNHDEQAACLRGLSYTVGCLGDHQAAEQYARQSLALCRRAGNATGTAWSYQNLAEESFAVGNVTETKRLTGEAVRRFEQLGNSFGGYCANALLGDARLADHEWSAAADAYRHCLAFRSGSDFTVNGGQLLTGLARAAVALLRPDRAALLYGARDGEAWGRERNDLPSNRDRTSLESARKQLGDEWDRLVDVGRRLTSDQVAALALETATELAGLGTAQHPMLTSREVEVIRLVAQGHGNVDVADQMTLSKRTVDAHLRSIFAKLAVASRTAAVHEATRLGLL